jgi:F-type H+-transporting ATPase subunit a
MNSIFVTFPSLLASAEGGEHGIGRWILAYVALTAVVVVLISYLAGKGATGRVFKGKLTQWGEQLYLFIEQLTVTVVGPHGRRYIPFITTLWLFIFVSNLLALFLPYAPTANLSVNLGLSITTILYVQWEGIKVNGFFGHIRHFAGPKLAGAMVAISGMIFIIEIISEAAKMLSLSMRLFGNIEGGHIVVNELNKLGSIGGIESAIPLGGLLLPIKVLTVIVQALVFCLLTCVYLGLVTHHDEEHSHSEHHDSFPVAGETPQVAAGTPA